MDKQAKIYVAGHCGLVGSALVRALHKSGYTNLVTRSHAELDLTDQAAVRAFFAQERPDCRRSNRQRTLKLTGVDDPFLETLDRMYQVARYSRRLPIQAAPCLCPNCSSGPSPPYPPPPHYLLPPPYMDDKRVLDCSTHGQRSRDLFTKIKIELAKVCHRGPRKASDLANTHEHHRITGEGRRLPILSSPIKNAAVSKRILECEVLDVVDTPAMSSLTPA